MSLECLKYCRNCTVCGKLAKPTYGKVAYTNDTQHPYPLDSVVMEVDYIHSTCREMLKRKTSLGNSIAELKEKLEAMKAEFVDLEFEMFMLRNQQPAIEEVDEVVCGSFNSSKNQANGSYIYCEP